MKNKILSVDKPCEHEFIFKRRLKKRYDSDLDIYVEDIECVACGGFYTIKIDRV